MNRSNYLFAILIILLIIASAISITTLQREQQAHDKYDIRALPTTLGNWKATEIGLTDHEYDLLGTRNLINRDYVNDTAEHINALIVYSETDRSIFHSPEGCMVGSGASITKKDTDMVSGKNGRFSVNRMDLEKAGMKDITLFCYKVGKTYTSSYLAQQTQFAARQLFGQRANGALIRVTMRVRSNDADTLAKLKDFLSALVEQIDEAIV